MSKEKKIHLCFVCQYVYPVCPCDNKTKIVWGSEESGNEKDDRIISCEEHKPRIDMICLLNKKDERIKELEECIQMTCTIEGKQEIDNLKKQLKEAENTLIKIKNWNEDLATYNPSITDFIKEYFSKHSNKNARDVLNELLEGE